MVKKKVQNHLIHIHSSNDLLTISNGIRIQSAVLSQYTFRTDEHTQTERWDRRQVYSNSVYALLIVSDALTITVANLQYRYNPTPMTGSMSNLACAGVLAHSIACNR